MAQEIVSWCDKHGIEARVVGTPRTFTVQGKTRIVDLCDPCNKELAGGLIELLDEMGRDTTMAQPVRPPRRVEQQQEPQGEAKHKCPIPDCQHAPMVRSTMRDHLERNHGRSLAWVETHMLHKTTFDGQPLTHPCPDKKCDLLFVSPQGAGAHAAAVHGLKSKGYVPVKKR